MIANVHAAKSQLSKLLDAVERGEEVIITRRGSGTNRFLLVPAPLPRRRELFGALKGQIVYSPDFDSADAEIEAMFRDSTESAGVPF